MSKEELLISFKKRSKIGTDFLQKIRGLNRLLVLIQGHK
jgi:hypothetical protein